MKEWECVELKHHRAVGKKIEEYQKDGWRLHTHSVTGAMYEVRHYLLFERGE